MDFIIKNYKIKSKCNTKAKTKRKVKEEYMKGTVMNQRQKQVQVQEQEFQFPKTKTIEELKKLLFLKLQKELYLPYNMFAPRLLQLSRLLINFDSWKLSGFRQFYVERLLIFQISQFTKINKNYYFLIINNGNLI